jgi:thiol-disulfide isomerase/thioredoxin
MKDNLKNGCPFCMSLNPKEAALSKFAGKSCFSTGKWKKLAGKVVNSAGRGRNQTELY